MLKLALAAALVALSSAGAMADGPFGVTMGDPITKYPSCKAGDRPAVYRCATLPKSHPDAAAYLIMAYPSTGACKVGMVSQIVPVASDGSRLRDKADAIAAQLSKTYGRYSGKYDHVANTSLIEPRYWMYTLNSEDRSYEYYWTGDGYKNNVESISVLAKATSASDGYVSVWIELKNFKACKAAIEADEVQVF
jgi:hypothetical protein